jgi:glyoxylase-like metal-dependent hydrolase (beta-lactamase superfamily II)
MLQIKQFTFSPMAENTYVLYNEERLGCIIDPGCYTRQEMQILEEFIKNKGITITHILLTHAHLDHVFGLDGVSKTYGLAPWMHPKEEPVLVHGPKMAVMYGMSFPAYTGDFHKLKEGDAVLFGGDKLEVIYAPGHSPGHVCYYCRHQDFLIGGDVLFQRSIGRTDLPLGDHETLIHSIREKLFVLQEKTIVHPGHGASTTIGEEKLFNPFVAG